MKNRILALAGLAMLAGTMTAQATPVTFTYTADNVLSIWGQCAVSSCQSPAAEYGAGPNASNWTVADSLTVDLAPGMYDFAFFVQNSGTGSSGNPGGFLGEISWGANVLSSSSLWDVTVCTDANPINCNFGGWMASTEYGANGGSNIWTTNHGGAVSGISTGANWIWSDMNFSSEMPQYVAFRATFTLVPEPSTVALLGLGLLSLGFAARRRRA